MKLSSQIKERIQKLAGSDKVVATTITEKTGSARIDICVETCESLACNVGTIRYDGRELRDASPHRLREIAERLVQQITYLMEPLTLIECDLEAPAVQVRSATPCLERGHPEYYELLVSRDGITFQRFAQAADNRASTPVPLTHQALLRMVDDLEEATAPPIFKQTAWEELLAD